jgi:hypothetical protein
VPRVTVVSLPARGRPPQAPRLPTMLGWRPRDSGRDSLVAESGLSNQGAPVLRLGPNAYGEQL